MDHQNVIKLRNHIVFCVQYYFLNRRQVSNIKNLELDKIYIKKKTHE